MEDVLKKKKKKKRRPKIKIKNGRRPKIMEDEPINQNLPNWL
jgi:hypothetical protein